MFSLCICVACLSPTSDVKNNDRYAYCHRIGNNEQYTYSQQFVDFIIAEIKKDPQKFVESLKKSQ